MSFKGIYREVWEDDELRENKVTQKTVRLVVDALGRVIVKSLKARGVFLWQNVFKLKAVDMKGWKTKSLETGEDKEIEGYKRVYINPSKSMKKELNKK